MRAGAGQGLLVFIALDRIEYALRLVQLAALGQAAGIEDQRRGMLVVFRQQHLEQRFGVGKPAFAE
ncbi:hypothetical protein D3C86_1922720 [compost metagenome]